MPSLWVVAQLDNREILHSDVLPSLWVVGAFSNKAAACIVALLPQCNQYEN